MKVVQFQHCSMLGSYWVPCEVIGETEEGLKIIRYFDLVLDKPVEDEVEDSYLRIVETEITQKYLSEVATIAAQKFKTDLHIVDDEQLTAIAYAVEQSLLAHFNYPD